MSHDFLDKSTNNHNAINEGKGEAMELESVNDFLISSENDTQTIVKEKGGSNRCENDIPNNSAAHRKIYALPSENDTAANKTIRDIISRKYNIFLIPYDDTVQAEIDEILFYDPANIPRCYEALYDIAAALRKFGRVLGKDCLDEDMKNYELLFIIWHGLYSEYIIQQDQQR